MATATEKKNSTLQRRMMTRKISTTLFHTHQPSLPPLHSPILTWSRAHGLSLVSAPQKSWKRRKTRHRIFALTGISTSQIKPQLTRLCLRLASHSQHTTGKSEERARSVERSMEWIIAIFGVLSADGKRHVFDSRTVKLLFLRNAYICLVKAVNSYSIHTLSVGL